jgi:acetyl-CoA acetyltransferase
MSDVYIAGIDMIKFGKYPDKAPADLGAQAVLMALDDAGLTIHDVQAVYSSNLFNANAGMGQQILSRVGKTGVAVTNVANACASGATAFRDAWISIKAGLYDVVLAVGSEQVPKGLLGGPTKPGTINPEGVFGSGTMPAVFAEIGMAHTAKYGTTFEQFAKVAVKNHHHSTMNPKAMLQKETSLEEVMGSEMIAYPLTKFMCSVNTDGAAAAILVSEKKAKELGMARMVKVRGSALASDPYEARNPTLFDPNTPTRVAVKAAYDMAGVGPGDLDLIELHDCFATAELLHYENLGLCADGDAAKMIEDGATALGGKIPVNVSGGLLSKGHPIGATGIANLYELSLHLRGEAGARQVEGARIGMAHVLGFGTSVAIHVLEKA